LGVPRETEGGWRKNSRLKKKGGRRKPGEGSAIKRGVERQGPGGVGAICDDRKGG